ncbi:hypothetical protein GFPCMMHI_06336 [Ensifer adhaerens]|nr:hypothetical protein [Ensifer adhaerens]
MNCIRLQLTAVLGIDRAKQHRCRWCRFCIHDRRDFACLLPPSSGNSGVFLARLHRYALYQRHHGWRADGDFRGDHRQNPLQAGNPCRSLYHQHSLNSQDLLPGVRTLPARSGSQASTKERKALNTGVRHRAKNPSDGSTCCDQQARGFPPCNLTHSRMTKTDLVQGRPKTPRKLGYIVVCPEIHEKQPRLVVEHVIVDGSHLDPAFSQRPPKQSSAPSVIQQNGMLEILKSLEILMRFPCQLSLNLWAQSLRHLPLCLSRQHRCETPHDHAVPQWGLETRGHLSRR